MMKRLRTMKSTKGATVIEYAVLLSLLAIVAIISVYTLGGNVRDSFASADDAIKDKTEQTPGDSGGGQGGGELPPEEPEEENGAPLVMSFGPYGRFIMEVDSVESATYQDPKIEWGPNAESCDASIKPGVHYYECYFTENTINVVEVYAPAARLGQFDPGLKGISSWGDIPLRSLRSAFTFANSMKEIPTNLPSSVIDLSYAFGRTSTTPEGNVFPDWNSPEIAILPAVSSWNVSSVQDMSFMFRGTKSVPPLDSWNTGSVVNMSGMFSHTDFNEDITAWDVSRVFDMSIMFQGAALFNQPIGDWNVSNVVNMSGMFQKTEWFNQDIGNWDTSNVEFFGAMFFGARDFNQDISNWNTSRGFMMVGMFSGAASFAQDVSSWDSTRFEFLNEMFYNTPALMGDYSSWRPIPASREAMNAMFKNSGATGDLRCWDVAHIPDPAFYFSVSSNISNDPLWGQARDISCAN